MLTMFLIVSICGFICYFLIVSRLPQLSLWYMVDSFNNIYLYIKCDGFEKDKKGFVEKILERTYQGVPL